MRRFVTRNRQRRPNILFSMQAWCNPLQPPSTFWMSIETYVGHRRRGKSRSKGGREYGHHQGWHANARELRCYQRGPVVFKHCCKQRPKKPIRDEPRPHKRNRVGRAKSSLFDQVDASTGVLRRGPRSAMVADS